MIPREKKLSVYRAVVMDKYHTWSTDYFEEVPVGRIDIKLLQNLI